MLRVFAGVFTRAMVPWVGRFVVVFFDLDLAGVSRRKFWRPLWHSPRQLVPPQRLSQTRGSEYWRVALASWGRHADAYLAPRHVLCSVDLGSGSDGSLKENGPATSANTGATSREVHGYRLPVVRRDLWITSNAGI